MRSKNEHITGDTPVESGAPDYRNSPLVDQLCDAVLSKLADRFQGQVTFNQVIAGSSPARLTSFTTDAATDVTLAPVLERHGISPLVPA